MKPRISPDNHRAVYEYYRNRQGHPAVARLGFAAAALLFRPHVTYVDRAKELLTDALEQPTGPLLVCNHLSTYDPFVVSGAAWQTPLRTTAGRLRALGKDSLFHHPAMRSLADNMGGIPVFRHKNYQSDDTTSAAQTLVDTVAHQLVQGNPAMLMPEGTINRTDDPSRILALKRGVAEIALRTRAYGGDPQIIPMAIHYPRPDHHRHAHVVIGEPLTDLGDSAPEILDRVSHSLQEHVTIAAAHSVQPS